MEVVTRAGMITSSVGVNHRFCQKISKRRSSFVIKKILRCCNRSYFIHENPSGIAPSLHFLLSYSAISLLRRNAVSLLSVKAINNAVLKKLFHKTTIHAVNNNGVNLHEKMFLKKKCCNSHHFVLVWSVLIFKKIILNMLKKIANSSKEAFGPVVAQSGLIDY